MLVDTAELSNLSDTRDDVRPRGLAVDREIDARMTTGWLVSVFDPHSSMPGPLRTSQRMLNGAQNEATDYRTEVATADVTNLRESPALIEQKDNGKASASPHDRDGDDAMSVMKNYDDSMLYHAFIE
ncbi:hypothetical protein BHYA_0175g00100 [Botrytis hyacinthi]|uniref:Uncharacterized protein n=1 Tax=Botrytis hyacinthi TaxID=278943 RepID=A0A4Z1GMN9_9HELO|nr:hypothetical protein BHYA_0175g00100 [Botrytis hyacinthi]